MNTPSASLDQEGWALLELGRWLRAQRYHFITPTPETHRRVNARPAAAVARTVRDVFGWSRPFPDGVLPAATVDLLRRAGALRERPDGLCASAVRFSTAGDLLLVHSAHPTLEPDAVFFGPDTYRFLALLAREAGQARRLVDVGCGTGAGGLSLRHRAGAVVLADLSLRALRLAAVNAALADGGGASLELVRSDVLAAVDGRFDLVVANPPYLVDDRGRAYRDGGGPRGTALSVRIAREALDRLEPGGRLVLYTASPIVDGRDLLRDALEPVIAGARASTYLELDPDVFGEELERDAYRDVERIAVVALTCLKP